MPCSGTGRAVQAEGGGRGVVTRPGALEADRYAPAWADRGVIAGVGGGDAGAALADCRVPRAGDLLVARERKGQFPATNGSGAGVADGDVGDEAASPFARLGVGDMAGAGGRRAGGR